MISDFFHPKVSLKLPFTPFLSVITPKVIWYLSQQEIYIIRGPNYSLPVSYSFHSKSDFTPRMFVDSLGKRAEIFTFKNNAQLFTLDDLNFRAIPIPFKNYYPIRSMDYRFR
jgi:hypothetical protein